MRYITLLLLLFSLTTCRDDQGVITGLIIPAEQLWACVEYEDGFFGDLAYYSVTYGGFIPSDQAANYLLTEAYSGDETPLVRGEILGGVLSVQVYVDRPGLRDLFLVGRFNAQTGDPIRVDLFYTGDLDQDGIMHEAEDYEYAEELTDLQGEYIYMSEQEYFTVIKLCLRGRGEVTGWPFRLVAGMEIQEK